MASSKNLFLLLGIVLFSAAVSAYADDYYSSGSYSSPVAAPAISPSPSEADVVSPSQDWSDFVAAPYASETEQEAPAPSPVEEVEVDDVQDQDSEAYAPSYSSPSYDTTPAAHYSSNQKVTTVVQGYVYCQSCSGYWDRHLSGAEVSVECKNEKGGLAAKGTDSTDENGFYQIKLPGYDHKSKYGSDEECIVKLVKSTDSTCNVVTNAGNGKQGASVFFLKTYHNEVFFKSGPFAYTQACPAY